MEITYDRVWVGMGQTCGVDMHGSAKVKMLYNTDFLESSIKKILELVKYQTMLGYFPIIKPISFSYHPKCQSLAQVLILAHNDKNSQITLLPKEIIIQIASKLLNK